MVLLSCSLATEETHLDWEERLPAIIYAMRTTRISSLGASPFEMEYGRSPRDLLSLAVNGQAVDNDPMIPTVNKPWLETLRSRSTTSSSLNGPAPTTYTAR